MADQDAPAPYGGDPPTDDATDSTKLYEKVDLDTEVHQDTRVIPFSIERPAGYYYLQLRTLLFRKRDTRVLAQLEQFFFGRSPLALLVDVENVALPIAWPSTAIEDMEYYATFRPGLPPTTDP